MQSDEAVEAGRREEGGGGGGEFGERGKTQLFSKT